MTAYHLVNWTGCVRRRAAVKGTRSTWHARPLVIAFACTHRSRFGPSAQTWEKHPQRCARYALQRRKGVLEIIRDAALPIHLPGQTGVGHPVCGRFLEAGNDAPAHPLPCGAVSPATMPIECLEAKTSARKHGTRRPSTYLNYLCAVYVYVYVYVYIHMYVCICSNGRPFHGPHPRTASAIPHAGPIRASDARANYTPHSHTPADLLRANGANPSIGPRADEARGRPGTVSATACGEAVFCERLCSLIFSRRGVISYSSPKNPASDGGLGMGMGLGSGPGSSTSEESPPSPISLRSTLTCALKARQNSYLSRGSSSSSASSSTDSSSSSSPSWSRASSSSVATKASFR